MIIDWLFVAILAFNFFFLLIVVYNYVTAPRINTIYSATNHDILISVLIPARNEEENIAKILDSLLLQSYKNLEILILNDDSIDNTAEIVNQYSVKDSRIKLINGKQLPSNWTGKNWACHQLSLFAKGEILLFIDADILLKKNSIKQAVGIFLQKNLSMLSVFPSQIIGNLGTYLVIPMMNWLLLNFLPLRKVYTSPNKSFVAANGQFLMFDKKNYLRIGGHAAVRNQIVEDMELARIIKLNGLKLMTALGDDSIFCKMYSSYQSSIKGFTKNFYRGFNTTPLNFILLLLFIEVIFLLPFILSFIESGYMVIVVIIITNRILISLISKQKPLLNVFLHVLQIVLFFYVGIQSIYEVYLGKGEWKGRKLY